MSSNDFREELDQRAIGCGCKRLSGAAWGSESGTTQGYSFTNGYTLQYIANDSLIKVQLRPQPSQGALAAGIQHAINPSIASSTYEERMITDLVFKWDSTQHLWELQSESQSNYRGSYYNSPLNSEDLAQSLVNWLCNQKFK